MIWTRFDEEANKQELLAIVEEMAALDKLYPELGVPSKVRDMQALGSFDIESRPWDCLIAIGYSILSLCGEESEESGQAIYLLKKRVKKALKYPMKWMYDTITPEVQMRYFRAAGRNLPRAVILRRRMPRSLKNKCMIFAWHEYEQLLYVLRRFCDSAHVVGWQMSDAEIWELLSVREMRDLVASMEKPPQSILEELNQQAIAIELEAIQHDLLQMQEKAKNLASLQYVAPRDSAELTVLEEIVQALGVDVKFAE